MNRFPRAMRFAVGSNLRNDAASILDLRGNVQGGAEKCNTLHHGTQAPVVFIG